MYNSERKKNVLTVTFLKDVKLSARKFLIALFLLSTLIYAVDYDLTKMSGTVVYAQVYDMMDNSRKYQGKIIRMKGEFAISIDPQTSKRYFACLIADAMACCKQGIEFVLENDPGYPLGYPKEGEIITIEGVFESYEEDGQFYVRLKNAQMSQ